jgi:hypothetical protein
MKNELLGQELLGIIFTANFINGLVTKIRIFGQEVWIILS